MLLPHLGFAYQRLGDHEKAIAAFDEVHRVAPDNAALTVYLIGAMDHENVWRMKPQNLLVGLPLIEGEPS